MILAVDTSLGTAVALIDADGERRAEAGAVDPLGHAEVIGDLLVDVIREAGDAEITHVVAGMGPGPFAAALTALESETAPFAIITDARRREVAITVFDGLDDDGIPVVVADTVLVRAADADAHLDGIRRIDVTTLSASDLARVGARALATGRMLAGEEPLYMRHPDVTLPGAPKKVGT